jgi:hypothetical protein
MKQWRQSRKISAGSQSSSSDHRLSPRPALHKERKVRWQRGIRPSLARKQAANQERRATGHAPVIADFCNKICQKQTFRPLWNIIGDGPEGA